MESRAEDTLATWTTPQCPIAIEYSRRVLDDIRLAVVDAFFSLPRGGAEIGGILLGKAERGKITVLDYRALDCEHAFGPSFTLSEHDRENLEALIAKAPGKLRVLGWYHSHTRSEIFLSDADVEIHKRFFPEKWQVALVMKPHTFQPTRAGWFFQDGEGNIHSEGSYQEFVLESLPLTPVPAGAQSPPAAPADLGGGATVINIARAVEEPQASHTDPEPEEEDLEPPVPPPSPRPIPVPPPSFVTAEPPRSRRWIFPVGILAGLAIGAAGYQTRQQWMPLFARKAAPAAASTSAPASVPAPAAPVLVLGLNTIDQNGQLQIRWDPNAPMIRNADGANLTIQDGPALQNILLDPAHLVTGVFTYARESERVDVTMVVNGPNGPVRREATSFLGKAPAAAVPASADASKDNAAREKETAQLRSDLTKQAERTRKLEKSVDDLRKLVQQRSRLGKQDPGK